MSIVSLISSDQELVKWALAMINGIIEDDRSRIKLLADLQKSKVTLKKCDCIGTLSSYLMRHREDAQLRPNRDLAAHTLAQLIGFRGWNANNQEECSEAQNFLTYLLDDARDNDAVMTRQAYTHCLMYLLKLNELTSVFIRHRGFDVLKKLLTKSCQGDAQIAYNVCCCFWILSYHKDAMPMF